LKPAKRSLLFFLLVTIFGHSAFASHTVPDSIAIYSQKNQDIKALKYAIKRSDYLLKKKQYNDWCFNSIQKSKIYLKLSDNKKAINVLYAALNLAEEKKLKFEQVLILNEIAKNFQQTLNYVKSQYYFKKGEHIAVAIKNDTLKAFIQQGLFGNCIQQNKKDSAAYYMKNIMAVHKGKGNPDQIYRCYSNYSNFYFNFDEGELGKKYLDTAIYFAQKNNKIKYLKTCYTNLGYYYLAVKNDYQKGEEQFLKILALNPNDSISSDVSDCYINLSYAYEQMKDYKNANKYLNKYIENTSAIFQNKINSQLRDTETKYEIEKVETEYKKKQLELEEKQSKNQKIFIVIILLISIIAILFYFFYQNIRLKEKNKLKDIETRIQQNIINATIDGQEIERKKIAGVLHDNISAQLSSAGLHLSAFSAITKTDSQEIAKTRAILKEAHDKVRDLSHELLPVLLSKFGLLYALQDLCEKNSNSLLEFDYSSNIDTHKRFNEDFEMKIYFIITELLNNVLKHSEATKAGLRINEKNNQLEITVNDNGKGCNTAKLKTNEGFGLTQIRARILNMNGTFNMASKNGTTVSMLIPIVK